MTSEASYISNPYATIGTNNTPPPIPGPSGTRRTPSKPPGLKLVDAAQVQREASFLLPLLNFVPMAKEYFETAQQLASSLLTAANALRLSISLEHSAFMWDCEKKHDQARALARQAIRDVYSSTDGLDDDEFADASALVQALGGIIRRGSQDPTPRQSKVSASDEPSLPTVPATLASRSLPPTRAGLPLRNRINSPPQQRSFTRTPERLSTVQEDPSQETSETAPTTLSPPASRASNRSRARSRRASSASNGEEKAAKRRALEQAEEIYRRNTGRSRAESTPSPNKTERAAAGSTEHGSRVNSRQNTPPDGYVRKSDQ